jgi:hypothetical protein
MIKDKLSNVSYTDQHAMTSKFENINEMLKQIDMGLPNDINSLPVFERLNVTSKLINHQIGCYFEDYFGIKGITYDTLAQVYNPHHSGIPSLARTRDHLVANGMSDSFASELLNKYLAML